MYVVLHFGAFSIYYVDSNMYANGTMGTHCCFRVTTVCMPKHHNVAVYAHCMSCWYMALTNCFNNVVMKPKS